MVIMVHCRSCLCGVVVLRCRWCTWCSFVLCVNVHDSDGQTLKFRKILNESLKLNLKLKKILNKHLKLKFEIEKDT